MIFIAVSGLNFSFFELLCGRQEQASWFWHWLDWEEPKTWPSAYSLHSWGWKGRKDASVGRMFYDLKIMFFKTSFSSRELIPADIKSDTSESICLHSLPLFLSQRVFVWDLDETIIIFHSLLTGTFASRYGKVRIHLSLFFSNMTLCAADLSRELWGQFMRQLL